jgi:hypothetical protein
VCTSVIGAAEIKEMPKEVHAPSLEAHGYSEQSNASLFLLASAS